MKIPAIASEPQLVSARKSRILIFINSMTGGGAERVVVSLSRHLVEEGHIVTVTTMHGTERDFFALDPRVGRVCLKLSDANRGLGKAYATVKRVAALRQVINETTADVVVGMMSSAAVLSILACARSKTRVVVSERNFPGKKPLPFTWRGMRWLLYRFADAHVAQTREAAVWLTRHARARNIRIVPNSVAWPVPGHDPAVGPDTVVDPDRRVVLAVGTKPRQKGFDILLRAFATAAFAHSDWVLVILGVAPSHGDVDGSVTDLANLAHELNIGSRVYLHGRVGNMTEWYQRADIFVLSSRYEGFPNALLEAMASGRPCIATDCDAGPRSIIENDVNGLLVPVEDTGSLGSAIVRLMDDANLRERLGSEATAVRTRYSENRVFGEWQKLLEELSS